MDDDFLREWVIVVALALGTVLSIGLLSYTIVLILARLTGA